MFSRYGQWVIFLQPLVRLTIQEAFIIYLISQSVQIKTKLCFPIGKMEVIQLYTTHLIWLDWLNLTELKIHLLPLLQYFIMPILLISFTEI